MANGQKINFNEYSFPTEEGTYRGTLDFKMYGKKQNILIYVTLESGEKLIGAAYKDKGYLGLKELDMDTKIEVTFKTSKSGLQRLTEVKQI